MKVEKNKIVFASVLAVIFIFLISYSMMVMGDDEEETESLNQTLVPELADDQKEYNSKLDAINDLKKVRETNAPSIYDEKFMDSTGTYNPDLPEQEKQRVVDSIYKANRIQYSDRRYSNARQRSIAKPEVSKVDSTEILREQKIQAKELGLEHQLFFAADPKVNKEALLAGTDTSIAVIVDGNQVVKANSRLRMRLAEDALINHIIIPKNTPVFGFISFQPNRALIEIENIDSTPTSLRAFDRQDGSEGIYIENNFRAEATGEVLDDVIQDINIPSVPQIGGITQVLRRKNRSVKVTVVNNYRLIFKPKL